MHRLVNVFSPIQHNVLQNTHQHYAHSCARLHFVKIDLCAPHTHTFLSSSTHNSVLLFLLSPSTQWHPAVGRDIREKQNRKKRKSGFGRKKGESAARKSYGKCEGKRELFKEKVRRVRAWKKIEREQVLKWEVSEGHVSDFLNATRQHGGGFSHGWRSGEASLMAYTSDERSRSPWKRELNNSEGGGKRERERSYQPWGSGWHVFKICDTVFKRREGSKKTAHRSGIIREQQHHFCCARLSDTQERTLLVCQCVPGTVALHQNMSCFCFQVSSLRSHVAAVGGEAGFRCTREGELRTPENRGICSGLRQIACYRFHLPFSKWGTKHRESTQ